MKIRINDLARELEVKSKAILDVLDELGVTEKKTHSSSLEDHEAEKVRKHFSAKSTPVPARPAVPPAVVKPPAPAPAAEKPAVIAPKPAVSEKTAVVTPPAAKP